MPEKYYTSITLSNINSEHTRRRVEKSIELFSEGLVETLLMSGGPVESPVSHAETMRDYAIERGVPPDRIHIEPYSLDTAGQAIILKLLLKDILPENRKNVTLVTSDFHGTRVEYIYNFVYGNGDFNIRYVFVDSGLLHNRKVQEREENSLKAFRDAFGDIPPGDHNRMLVRLFREHPLYRNNPLFDDIPQFRPYIISQNRKP